MEKYPITRKSKAMDFEQLGAALINDFEDDELYIRVEEGAEISRSVGKFDVEEAKGFMSKVHPRLNISLYDHLADLVKMIIRSRIPDAVDRIEELSLELKKTRLRDDSDFQEVDKADHELQGYIKEKEGFYRLTPTAADVTQTRIDDEADSDESETEQQIAVESKESRLDETSQELSEALPDIHFVLGRFRQAGIGLTTEESFELNIALRNLAVEFNLHRVRFWGKVLGLKNDIYVAEAPHQQDIVYDDFGWVIREENSVVDENETEEKTEGNEESKEDVEEKDDTGNEDQSENMEEQETPKEQLLPEKKPMKKRVPPEPAGTGVNEYVYFACTKLGQPWRVLPFMTPLHIAEARYLKRFFTGDLESQIGGGVPFPGREAHYLRAQIGRITASTYIAPVDFYTINSGEEENDEEDDSETGDLILNDEYVPKSTIRVYSEGVDAWVHYRKAVLDQGRCIPMKLEKENGGKKEGSEDESDESDETIEKGEEEEEQDILEAIEETEVPLLRCLSEDKGVGRMKPWRMKMSSRVVPETAILVVQSHLWPGAYTFYDGKTFEHIYIGYAYKFSVFNYAPPNRAEWQEYPVRHDVTEQIDEEIVENETQEKEPEVGDGESVDEETVLDEYSKEGEEH